MYNLMTGINKIVFSVFLFIVLLGKYSTILFRLDYIVVPLLLLFLQLLYKPKYDYKEILFILLLFFMMLWPILFYQNLFNIGSFKYLFYVIFGICISKLILFFYDLVLSRKSFIQIAYITIIIFFIINLIIAIWEIRTGNHLRYSDVSRYTVTWKNIPAGMFFNVNDYAIFIVTIIPIFILYNDSIFSLVMLLFSLLLIISTGSRTALLSAFLSIFVSLAIYFRIDKVKKKKRLIIIVLLLSLSFLALLHSENNNSVLISKLMSGDFISQLNKSRFMVYREYISIALGNPFGMGATAFGLWDGTSLTNPHNLYIELLLNFGLFGGSLVYISLIYLAFKSLKKSFFNEDNFFLSTSISLLILLVISNVGVSRLLYGFPIFWIYLGFSLCSLSDDGKD